jgi:hypothetical protein
MPIPNPSIAFALFDEKAQAEAALAKLREASFGDDQLELTACDDEPAPETRERRGIFSPIRTLLLGGEDPGAHLYERLVELGVSAEEAQRFREQIDQGKALATVICMRREREAADILRQFGGRSAFEPEQKVRTQESVIKEDVAGVGSAQAAPNGQR